MLERRSKRTLVLCIIDSGTMGWIWYSRSADMVAICSFKSRFLRWNNGVFGDFEYERARLVGLLCIDGECSVGQLKVDVASTH